MIPTGDLALVPSSADGEGSSPTRRAGAAGAVEHPRPHPHQPAALRPRVRLRNRPAGSYLVDAGWNTDDAFDTLTAGLAEAGASITDVRGVMVTHIHPDHYGLAGRVRETSGAWVALHPADAALIPDRYEEPDEPARAHGRHAARAGRPARGARGAARRVDARPAVRVHVKPDVLTGGRRQARDPRLGPAGHLDAGPLPRPPLLLGAPQPADADRRPRPAPHHPQHRPPPPVGRRPAGRLPHLAGEAGALRQRGGPAGPRAPLRRPPRPPGRADANTTSTASTRSSERSGPATTPPGRSPARMKWSRSWDRIDGLHAPDGGVRGDGPHPGPGTPRRPPGDPRRGRPLRGGRLRLTLRSSPAANTSIGPISILCGRGPRCAARSSGRTSSG